MQGNLPGDVHRGVKKVEQKVVSPCAVTAMSTYTVKPGVARLMWNVMSASPFPDACALCVVSVVL